MINTFLRAVHTQLAWWDVARRQRRNLRKFRKLGPIGQAEIVLRTIERDADMRQRFRQAIGINMAGRRRGPIRSAAGRHP